MVWKITFAFLVLVGLTGCGSGIIDYVSVTPAKSQDSIQVSLVFKATTRLDLMGETKFGEYGSVFFEPWSHYRKPEMGFTFKTAIANDSTYLTLPTTLNLPNGAPIGADSPLIEVAANEPISEKFDLHAYFDPQGQWLGAAALFQFIDELGVPADITLQYVLLHNDEGASTLFASIFGPSTLTDGSIKNHGGIALFAKVGELFRQIPPGERKMFSPEENPKLVGSSPGILPPISPSQMNEYQEKLVRGANKAYWAQHKAPERFSPEFQSGAVAQIGEQK